MSLASDLKAFALKGNVIDLAVAVVIGAAFTRIVNVIVEGLIMPLVGLVLPGGNWRQYQGPLGLRLGEVLGTTIDFVVVAIVLFLIVSKLVRRRERPAPATTKTCPDCLETIPLGARKVRACGSMMAAAALLLACWPGGL